MVLQGRGESGGGRAEGAPTAPRQVQPPDAEERTGVARLGEQQPAPRAGRGPVVRGAPAGAEAEAFEVGGRRVVGTGRANGSPGGPGPRWRV